LRALVRDPGRFAIEKRHNGYIVLRRALMDQLAAVREAQARRFAEQKAAAAAAEQAAAPAGGSSRRKGSAPQKRVPIPAAPPVAEVEEEEDEPEQDDVHEPVLKRLKSAPAPTKRARITTLSVEDLARHYYTNEAGSDGVLQREGDAQNRLRSAEAGTVAFSASAGRLTVVFRGLRRELEERVQELSKEEVQEVLRAVLGKSSSRRSASAGHLLAPLEMASRSPTAFWNAVRHFGSAKAAAEAAKQGT
jgi:hypothetical protein